jgi:HAMP domain-containing protein
VLVAVAVALATYPITRKLTRRLERLQNGVQQWGEGDLSTRVNESGQDEVADLGRRFNQAAERVQTLVQSHEALLASQKSLLANASHELRSPLTRIRMGLELMGGEASSASRLEISRNITELDQLIEEILLASRLDAREADLGPIESVDLIGLAAEECARVGAELLLDLDPAWHAAPTAPSGDAALPVQGVAKLLRRAVRNLLGNAHRHAAGAILQMGVKELIVIHFPEGCFARTRDGKDHWQPSLKVPDNSPKGSRRSCAVGPSSRATGCVAWLIASAATVSQCTPLSRLYCHCPRLVLSPVMATALTAPSASCTLPSGSRSATAMPAGLVALSKTVAKAKMLLALSAGDEFISGGL